MSPPLQVDNIFVFIRQVVPVPACWLFKSSATSWPLTFWPLKWCHQIESVSEDSDHLELIIFWPSHAPGKGVCGGANVFGSALLQPARNVCVSVSSFFIQYLFRWKSAYTLLVGRQEGHPACKTFGVGSLVVMIWLELCTSYSSNCHHHL